MEREHAPKWSLLLRTFYPFLQRSEENALDPVVRSRRHFMSLPLLGAVEVKLRNSTKKAVRGKSTYAVPSLLVSGTGLKSPQAIINTNYYKHYLNQFQSILSSKARRFSPDTGEGWTRNAVVYNMF